MKKLWAGVLILGVLLAAGIGAAVVMQHIHSSLATRLEQAAGLSQSDWDKANSLADSAKADWEQHHHWIAALVDHEPLEEITNLFSQLSLCQNSHDIEDFAAVSLRIAGICSMLAESHSPYWWNLL